MIKDSRQRLTLEGIQVKGYLPLPLGAFTHRRICRALVVQVRLTRAKRWMASLGVLLHRIWEWEAEDPYQIK